MRGAAAHLDRKLSFDLLAKIDDLQALCAAQQILVRCGAVTYGTYHIIKRFQAAREILLKTHLVDHSRLPRIRIRQIEPLRGLLENLRIPPVPELTFL